MGKDVDEVQALALRVLRARLAADVPLLQALSSRWLVYRMQALYDGDADGSAVAGERWHWANPGDADHEAIWTAIRVWDGNLLPLDVTFQDFPDGTQHAFVPFACDDDSIYSVVCQAEDDVWRYHDTTRAPRDDNPILPLSSTSSMAAALPSGIPSRRMLGAAAVAAAITSGNGATGRRGSAGSGSGSGSGSDDDYWSKYDSVLPVIGNDAPPSRADAPPAVPDAYWSGLAAISDAAAALPTGKPPIAPSSAPSSSSSAPPLQRASSGLRNQRASSSTTSASSSSSSSSSSVGGRRTSAPSRHNPSAFSLQREKQLRDAIKQSIKGLYAVASLNGLSAGEFISLVKDVCEL